METDLHRGEMDYLVPRLLGAGSPPYAILDERVVTTKLDAPYTTFSINEEVEALDFPKEPPREGIQGINLRSVDDHPPYSPETETGITITRNDQSRDENSEMSNPLIDAVNAMPSHRLFGVGSSWGRSRGQEAEDEKNHSEGLTINRGTAYLKKSAVGTPLIRKYKQAGVEEGVYSVSISQFKEIQHNIRNWEEKSRRIEARTYLSHSNDAARISDNSGTAGGQPDTNNAIAGARGTETAGERPPTRKIDHGPRILKQHVNNPSLMSPRLPSLGRRRVLENLVSEVDEGMTADDLIGGSSKTPRPLRVLRTSEPLKGNRTKGESKTESVSAAPTVRFICEEEKSSLPRDEPILTLQDIPITKVRKHLSISKPAKASLDFQPSYNHKMPTLRVSGKIKGRPPEAEPRKGSYRKVEDTLLKKDLGWDPSPGFNESTPRLIRRHQSHGAAPVDARDKAKYLHERYHQPLLDS